jgi:predicted O-methyltransferase YrrM
MEDYHQLLADSVTAHAQRLGRSIDYIEVGVFRGESALAVLGSGHCRWATLIDNFSNTHCGNAMSSLETVQKNLANYDGIFEIKIGDSRDVLPLIKCQFDIGFVDGDHTIEGCRGDMEQMFPLIREDGILFVDDMQNTGYMHIKALAEQFASEKGLQLTYHEVHNGVGELRR